MKNILTIQAIIFILLTYIGFILHGLHGLGISLIILMGIIIGPFMAYQYPWNEATHTMIIVGLVISFIFMIYGTKKRKDISGQVIFTIGFWAWAFISLVYGLGTGT